MDEILKKIKRAVLSNAVEHGGTANSGAAMGRIASQYPDLREKMAELRSIIDNMVSSVNEMSKLEQKKELDELGGLRKALDKRVHHKKGLPELDVKKGVVLRFAPNPDGALHMGNARPAVLSYEYAKKYGGKLILRFDDTDPKVKIPEKKFYKWIREDLRWLGLKWKKEVVASKRLRLYYTYAAIAMKKGFAYICTCEPKLWRQMRDDCKPCPCRQLSRNEHIARWEKFINAKYPEGGAVLRIKTDLSDPNPAVRDWSAMRIVKKSMHPLDKRSKIWPLYNFASAIDDHELKITAILRGQEHSTNETKQRFLYDHFGWKHPQVVTLGRFLFREFVLSKSLTRAGIAEKKFSGWDDPRLGSLRALRRRGFQPGSIRNMIMDIGVQSSDAVIAFENLASYNRKFIDPIANRYFFIADPITIDVIDPPLKKASVKLHPKKEKVRQLRAGRKLWIDLEDFNKYHNTEIRLIGLYNIILNKTSDVMGVENKPIQKIHWLPETEFVKMDVVFPEKTIHGIGERAILNEKVCTIIQGERFGFMRIEKKTRDKVTAVFLHK
ncbi:MAG: glutamate--tRNA ligase [Candidatus Aenigmatarchaeota archaeon]